MKLVTVLLLFVNVILILVDGACGHPKSWLTTTTRRPKPKPKQRPKRSVDNWDVTYYPGLTAEYYKDDLKFEQLEKFIQEERENSEGQEEEAMLSLLKEEKHEPATEEPVKFAFQKRVVFQLKNPNQETYGDIKFRQGHPVFEPHLGHPGTGHHKFFKFNSVEKAHKPHYGEAKKLLLNSGTSNMHNIPRGIIKRLLLDESVSRPCDERQEFELKPPVDNTLGGYLMHHDTDVNFLRRLQENRENRYQDLLKHLLDQQDQISEQNLKFLRIENEEQSHGLVGENEDKSTSVKSYNEGENYESDEENEIEDGNDDSEDED